MIIIKNCTGYEIELENGTTLNHNLTTEVDEIPSMLETIVYNENDCKPYLDYANSYKDYSGNLFINLYI